MRFFIEIITYSILGRTLISFIHKWPFSAISALICGIACAACQTYDSAQSLDFLELAKPGTCLRGLSLNGVGTREVPDITRFASKTRRLKYGYEAFFGGEKEDTGTEKCHLWDIKIE
jgi:hypothetical protein